MENGNFPQCTSRIDISPAMLHSQVEPILHLPATCPSSQTTVKDPIPIATLVPAASSSTTPPLPSSPSTAPEYSVSETQSIRSHAKQLGHHAFIHQYLFEKKSHLPSLIRIFRDQFTDSEWADIEADFLSSDPQIHELYACLHIAVQRFVQVRKRLPHFNSLAHVLDFLPTAKRILLVSGAGISVSCGIPDFRSSNGIYARLDDYELSDPTDMFDLQYFKYKPETFYSFAKEIYPSNFKPSPSHMFIALLEQRGQLLRNYTQNIDNIEELAGIQRVIQCHGSFRTAKCLECGYTVPGNAIEQEVFAQQVPRCPKCPPNAVFPVMKPDIVFFGEQLPKHFHDTIGGDLEVADLVIVIGSSLKVAPVAEILRTVPEHVPQVIINRELLPHMKSHFDVHLLGDADSVIADLCLRLGWTVDHAKVAELQDQVREPELFGDNVYVYEGGQVAPTNYGSSSSSSCSETKKGKLDGGVGGERKESSEDEELNIVGSSECLPPFPSVLNEIQVGPWPTTLPDFRSKLEDDDEEEEELTYPKPCGLASVKARSVSSSGCVEKPHLAEKGEKTSSSSSSSGDGGDISQDELAGLRADLCDDADLMLSVQQNGESSSSSGERRNVRGRRSKRLRVE